MDSENATFWDHLDELRSVIIRILVVTGAVAVVAFCFKQLLFAAVLAPQNDTFITYQWFDAMGRWLSTLTGTDNGIMPGASEGFNVRLINTELAQQFIIHMKVAFCVGVLVASPYIVYQLFRFISPALYQNERKYAFRLVGGSYIMFMVGAAFSYFIIFPFTFRFLGTYQVADMVVNTITLESYISTMMTLTIAMGVVFEMPVLSWLLAQMRLLSSSFMIRYRKHVVVFILIAAAIITPTSDAFTLMLVSLPMWMLYEISIFIVKAVNK